MKIGLAHKRLDLKGGTERDLYRTAEGLRDLGHEVHLYCCEYGIPPPVDTFAHRVPHLRLGRTSVLWSFAHFAPKVIQRHPCDVVVGFGRMLQQDVLRCGGGSHLGFLDTLGRESGAPRRFWQRISPYHRSVLAIEKRQFQATRFKKILAVSAEVKRDLMKNYSVPDDRIDVIYNGVDQQRFHPSRRQQALANTRGRWQIPHNSPLVLFVGSGFRRKGLNHLLSIWNSPRLKDAYLLVVGDDSRIGSFKAWADTIAEKRVIFTGRQEDVENYYAAADVVALPALQEAFGNVVLEALASGVAVLVSRTVGAAELLTGRLAEGIVNRPEDLTELESTLVTLLHQRHDSSRAIAARQLGEEFSWQNHFRNLEVLLMEVCEPACSGSLS